MDPTHLHVVSNMTFIDVFVVNLSAQLLLILLEASKSPVAVRNISQQTEADQGINCMLPNSTA